MAQGATRKRARQLPVRQARRWLRAALGALVLLAIPALLGLAGWRLMQVPVERIIVSGELQRVTRQDLVAVINGSLQGGFLWMDLDRVRAPLEQLPWVYRVVVKRRWPASLEISVTEQRPIARWGGSAYLNHAGEVFSPGRLDVGEQLARLDGPRGTQGELMRNYKLIQDQLQPRGLQVSELVMNERGGLSARLLDGGQLVFGRGDVEAKLGRFLRIYRARLQDRPGRIARVDLRYSNGAAVAWQAPAKNEHRT